MNFIFLCTLFMLVLSLLCVPCDSDHWLCDPAFIPTCPDHRMLSSSPINAGVVTKLHLHQFLKIHTFHEHENLGFPFRLSWWNCHIVSKSIWFWFLKRFEGKVYFNRQTSRSVSNILSIFTNQTNGYKWF